AHKFSASAREKIEKAGGKVDVIVLPPKGTPQQRKAAEKKAAAGAEKPKLRQNSGRPGGAVSFANAFSNLFKIQELRKRLAFTLMCLAVYRIGVFVTAPGV